MSLPPISPERLRDFVAATSDWLWETDDQGRYTYASDQVTHWLGYQPSEVIGRSPFDLMPSDEAERARADFEAIARDHQPFAGLRHACLHRDGHIIHVEASGVPWTDAEGQFKGYRGVIRDVSARVKAEEERRHSQKMQAVGQLAGGIAHDLNNLLCPILGYCEMVLEAGPLSELVDEAIGEIRGAADRAREMVSQLLSFSRMRHATREPLAIDALVSGFQRLLRHGLREDIELTVVPSDTELVVLADAGLVEQALMNLVVNAQDAMPRGGRIVIESSAVAVCAESSAFYGDLAPGNYAVLAVADQGCGMDEATRCRVFEPFYTTKPLGAGTGLGLSTAYAAIGQHGGTIHCYSEVGSGTVFRVYLPLSDAAPAAQGLAAPRDTAHLSGDETVLVVDDDEGIRGFVGRALSLRGYQVLLAANAAECLAHLSAADTAVDLVLADVVMPGSQGDELSDQIRALRPRLPVLFMSGYTGCVLAARGIGDQDSPLLAKPFSVADLLHQTRAALAAAAGPDDRSGG